MQKTKIANRARRWAWNRSRAGLTLIEMIVALGAACIILLAMSSILVFGQKSWNRTLQQAALQRDASYAILKMARSIRAGTTAQPPDESGQSVKVFNDAGWTLFWFDPSQNQLRYQLEGEQEQTLLDGIVEDATFVVDPNTNRTVTIDLELKDGTCETRLSSTVLMRNYPSGT